PAPGILRACLDSVISQGYRRWELCVVDDGSDSPEINEVLREFSRREPERMRVTHLQSNAGIAAATNAAFALSRGEYVCFLDHDDLLAPTALEEIALAIQATPQADMLYSDEDKVGSGRETREPLFKPDWSPDLLRSCNYVAHVLVVRRELLERLEG